MAAPNGAIKSPRFGILGVAYGASSATKSGVASASSKSTLTVNVVIAHVAKVDISSKVTLSSASAITKQGAVQLSSKVTAQSVPTITHPAVVGISSKVTVASVSQLTKNPVVGISSKATLSPVSQSTKNPVVGISSKVTLSPNGQKSGNPTGNVSASSTATLTLNAVVTHGCVVSLSSKVTATFVTQLTKNPTTSISAKATLLPVVAVIKNQNVAISSKVTFAPNGQKVGNPTGVAVLSGYASLSVVVTKTQTVNVQISSKATFTSTVNIASIKNASVGLSSKTTVTPIGFKVIPASVLLSSKVTTSVSASKTIFTSVDLSSHVDITVVAIRSYIPIVRFVRVTTGGSTTVTVVRVQGCICPEWVISDYTTCNWSAADTSQCGWLTTGTTGIAQLPFTLPVFRFFDLSHVTTTPLFTYDYTTVNPYTTTSTLSSSWNILYNATNNWENLSEVQCGWSALTLFGKRTLPYTLPIFRLHVTSLTPIDCQYDIVAPTLLDYTVSTQNNTFYQTSSAVSGGWTRKGCE